jgi:spore coat polysaccharide biosynthesis predicted glycosyltransferase SpsG/CMP-N-acetylneuraminic acid synthetase
VTEPFIVIPARGGSVSVPRKNLRMLVGKPLISHTIDIALGAVNASRIAVITDDDEIAEIALSHNVSIIREKQRANGIATLDELILRHLVDIQGLGATDEDILITMQPTCPLIDSGIVAKTMAKFEAGAGSVLSAKDDRHLSWTKVDGEYKPLYEARVNRQWQTPKFRESGAVIASRVSSIKRHKTRIVEPVALIELPEDQALDIDSFADLVVAEHYLTRKTILIHANAATELGMGHVYRALALSQELARHNLLIVTSHDKLLGSQFFESQVFAHRSISSNQELVAICAELNADLVVLDVLDTDQELVEDLKQTGAKVVSFEDSGSGAAVADLVVSDIYPSPTASKQLVGIRHAILAPGFEILKRQAVIKPEVEHVLVLFGGTDPSNLADFSLRALEAIGYAGKVSCVRGLGATDILGEFDLDLEILRNVTNMPQLMASADLALSSAGRTITELASIGVPTICLVQNQKELTHTHAVEANGVINLGLGANLSKAELQNELVRILGDFELRKKLASSALSATKGRSNAAVVSEIMRELS